jgi:hypothetical protein
LHVGHLDLVNSYVCVIEDHGYVPFPHIHNTGLLPHSFLIIRCSIRVTLPVPLVDQELLDPSGTPDFKSICSGFIVAQSFVFCCVLWTIVCIWFWPFFFWWFCWVSVFDILPMMIPLLSTNFSQLLHSPTNSSKGHNLYMDSLGNIF